VTKKERVKELQFYNSFFLSLSLSLFLILSREMKTEKIE